MATSPRGDSAYSLLEGAAEEPGHGHSHGNSHGHGHGHGHDCGGGRAAQKDLADGGSPATWSQSMGWLRAHDPAECAHDSVEGKARDLVGSRHLCCDPSVLHTSTNVIVLVRANELVTMSRVNTVLAFTAVLYMAMNAIGILLNSYDNDCDVHKDPSCSPATTPAIFHNLEFWSAFVFNTVDLLALNYSPKRLSNQYQNPTLLKLIVLLNVGLSFLSCVLVAVNLEKFEVLSHEIEYVNEITIAIFDIMILLSLIHGRTHETTQTIRTLEARFSCLTLTVALSVAVLQLGTYNLCGWTRDGDSKGEQMAHYLEFVFGLVSAGIAFWFTMDNRMTADKRMRTIMYGGACSDEEV